MFRNMQPHNSKHKHMATLQASTSTQQTDAMIQLCRHRENEWISSCHWAFVLCLCVYARLCASVYVAKRWCWVKNICDVNGTFFHHIWLVFAVDSFIGYHNIVSWSCIFSIARSICKTKQEKNIILFSVFSFVLNFFFISINTSTQISSVHFSFSRKLNIRVNREIGFYWSTFSTAVTFTSYKTLIYICDSEQYMYIEKATKSNHFPPMYCILLL